MNKIVIASTLIFSLVFFPLLANAEEDGDFTLSKLQEYCAKEQDPVKRLHYCNALEQYSEAQTESEEAYAQSIVV